MLRHGIHTSVPRQNKRAAYGKFSEQFEDKGRNQLQCSSISCKAYDHEFQWVSVEYSG